MMIRHELLLELAQKLSTAKEPMENLRDNLSMYIDEPEISLRSIADDADVSVSTLNSILYGKAKDCYMTTLVALANALDVSIDELIGTSTLPRGVAELARIWRRLPLRAQQTLLWFARHEETICGEQPNESHVISIISPQVNQYGNLRIPGEYSSIDINGKADQEICRKVIWGLQLGVDFYMPTYSPYDVLLIANDRPATSAESAVIVLDQNLFLARRLMDYGGACYYSIRDGKYRVRESECAGVAGYVAGMIPGVGFIEDGRY